MEEWIEHKPLKVLMTTDTIGGVWSYTVELCQSLQSFDVHFYLLTTGAPLQPYQKEEISKLQNVTVYETTFLLEWMENPWQNIDSSRAWMLQFAAELQPDLVHLNSYAYGSLPWKLPVVMVAHSDVFSWWRAVKKAYPPAEWNEYFKRVHKGLKAASFIIAPSNVTLRDIRKIYSATAPGKVIYNSRRTSMFYSAKKQQVVFSMGRIWDEAKNIRLLVQAAKQIPYLIKLAGDASFGKEQCTITGSNITNLGRLPSYRIAAELSVASVYVLPARYEPFGLSILEAALSGCALVLGNIQSLKEIWGDSALYIDTDDAAALADTVNYLIENESLRLQYAHKAMERAKKYTTTTMANNYMEVYRGLAQSKKQLLKQ